MPCLSLLEIQLLVPDGSLQPSGVPSYVGTPGDLGILPIKIPSSIWDPGHYQICSRDSFCPHLVTLRWEADPSSSLLGFTLEWLLGPTGSPFSA